MTCRLKKKLRQTWTRCDELEHPSDELFCNFPNCQGGGSGSEQVDPIQFETYNVNLDGFFDFGLPPTGGKPSGIDSQFTRVARLLNGARTAQFKAEATEREVARLREEAAANSLCERESAAKEVRRVYRNGKKEVAEIMKTCFSQFLDDFGELKKTFKSVGHYYVCRGTVGGLYPTQSSGYSYDNGMAKQSKRMDMFANMDYMISHIEKKILDHSEEIGMGK
ncbi:hypothetical protein Bca4012_037618 [Brassica carinata]